MPVPMFRRKPPAEQAAPVVEPVQPVTAGGSAPKGRPTPKRRTQPTPPPPPPKTRKEAAAWQKQRAATAKVAGQQRLSSAEYRQALKDGDPRVLPKRDQGPVRQLARDYVDSRRMASNYLLWLIPLMLVGYALPYLQILSVLLLVLLAGEWMYTGSRVRRMANERGMTHRESMLSLGSYAGMRAYSPRRVRRPQPRVQLGEQI